MTARPTAEIIADLRWRLDHARNRLAELDANQGNRFRYLCTSGHHVGAVEGNLTVCPARPVLGWISHGVPDYGPPCGAELRHYSADPAWELEEIHESLPDCPTCDGKAVVNKDYWSQDADDCPDCVDGKQSWEQVVRDAALWNARTR